MAFQQDHRDYVSFWDNVAETFPSLKGAASTHYYFECERLLFERFVPTLKGQLLLKIDLWNEVKNTDILRWVGDRGAHLFGIDIAFRIVREAAKTLAHHRPALAVADVRRLPFATDTFDLVYSMGTIEHLPDYEVAVREMFRVLKPQGTAIIGLPNKFDPFLRPLLVLLLRRCGLYAYGREKSFTPQALGRLLESAGFRVMAHTGLLFMPGWLRMMDLWCHTRFPPLATLTSYFVRPFAWLYRRVPWVRRHGYLIACVVSKPAEARSTLLASPALKKGQEC